MKLFFVQTEVFNRRGALRAVPRVGHQHSANIPENGANLWQSNSPVTNACRRSCPRDSCASQTNSLSPPERAPGISPAPRQRLRIPENSTGWPSLGRANSNPCSHHSEETLCLFRRYVLRILGTNFCPDP